MTDVSGVRRRPVEPQNATEWRFYTRLLFRLVSYKMKRDNVEYLEAKSWATPFVESELEIIQSQRRIDEVPWVRSGQ